VGIYKKQKYSLEVKLLYKTSPFLHKTPRMNNCTSVSYGGFFVIHLTLTRLMLRALHFVSSLHIWQQNKLLNPGKMRPISEVVNQKLLNFGMKNE